MSATSRDAWRTGWFMGMCLGALGCLAFLLAPQESIANAVAYQIVTIGAIAVLLTSILQKRRGSRGVWWAVLAYIVLSDIGDLVYDWQAHITDEPPYPGPADAFYSLAYVAALGALAMLIRRVRDGQNLEAWIDTAILAIAAIAVVGVLIIEPILISGDQTVASVAFAVAYPLLDIILLSGLARLLIGRGRLNPSLALLSTAFLATFLADLAFSFVAANGLDGTAPRWLDVLYLVAFVLMAGAASAPGSSDLRAGPLSPSASARQVRVSTLALGALIVPAVLVYVTFQNGGDQREYLLLALACVAILLLVLWRFRLVLDVVEAQSEQLASLARTDSLTGLPNRRTLDFELERIEAEATVTGRPLTIAMLDLDHFKVYNDVHGHQTGDTALIACARAWLSTLAPPSFIARYGGEEFAVLLPGTRLADAHPLLEALRTATPQPHTVSIGYAERLPGESGFQTMSRADRSLYLAKQAGRNRTHTTQELPTSVRQ